jgi:hypothetical protein
MKYCVVWLVLLYFRYLECKRSYNIASEWLLFSSNSAIFQLYLGENKLIFNENLQCTAHKASTVTTTLPLQMWLVVIYLTSEVNILMNMCLYKYMCRWFSPGTLVSSTNKTDHHDITDILLKVALNTINHKPQLI